MFKEKDIERAINQFQRWDLERTWKAPEEVFVIHLKEKADDCLDVAKLLMELIGNREILFKVLGKEHFNPTLWIINASYYSIFFNAQLLLAQDGKAFSEGTEDTHKSTLLALLFYFIIKGSGLEGKKKIKWEDIKESRMSRALTLFAEAQEESEELFQWQRAKKAMEDFGYELEKRHKFTYRMNFHASENIAQTSYQRAIEFRTIITEYLSIKRK